MFKVRSTNRCGSGVEGTGFLYAPHRLMTNAHVVAGVTEPVALFCNRTLQPTTAPPDESLTRPNRPAVSDCADNNAEKRNAINIDLKGSKQRRGKFLLMPAISAVFIANFSYATVSELVDLQLVPS